MNACTARSSRWLCYPWFVFGFALLLHVLIVLGMGSYRNPTWMESGAIASFLYEGKGFSAFSKSEQRFFTPEAKHQAAARVARGEPAPMSELHPTCLHSPGYPYFLYLTWKVLGRNPGTYLTICLFQALLISSLVFPVGGLTRRWFGDRAAGWARWITAWVPLYAYYATQLLPVAVFISFHPWLLMAWLKLGDRITLGRSVGVGLLTGLGALFQPLLLAVTGLIGSVFLGSALQRGRFKDAAWLVINALVVLLILTPWTVRNYRVCGKLIPIRSGSDPFWVGNNPHATGAAVIEGGAQDIYVAYPPKCIVRGTELTEFEYHEAMKREALDFIRSHPLAFVRRTSTKIFWFWTTIPGKYVVRQGSAPGAAFRSLHLAYWFAFLSLAITARLLHGKFPREYVMILVLYVVLWSAIYGLLHVGQARFRGEIEFIFIPAVAQGIVLIWRRLAPRRRLGSGGVVGISPPPMVPGGNKLARR